MQQLRLQNPGLILFPNKRENQGKQVPNDLATTQLNLNKMKQNRITSSLFIFLSILVLAFSACKKEKSFSVIGEASASLNAVSELKSQYEKQSGTKIETRGFPFEEAFEKANLDFANKTGLYDIVMQYNFSLSSFVRNDYVYPLDELLAEMPDSLLEFESDLFQSAWEEVGYYYKNPKKPSDGIEKVGYPFAANTMLLLYNKEMFGDSDNQARYLAQYGKELVVPRTWEDYRNIAAFFTNPDKNEYGICITGADGGWLYYEWTSVVHGMGAKVMGKKRGWEGDVDTEVLLDSKGVLDATEYFISLKPYNKGAFFDLDMYKQSGLIKEGNVAMSLIWSDIAFTLIDEGNGKFDDRFGFAEVPGDHSMLAGGAFFINKQSKHAKDAAAFIVWLMQKENQIEMVKYGLCSPRKSVYDEPSVQFIPYLKPLRRSLDRGIYMAEAGPDADLINQKVTTYVQKAWRGELSAKEALDAAKRDIEAERKAIFEAL